MAKTVNTAFSQFMSDVVNLDPDIATSARQSRDNLLSNIAEFDNIDDFFDLCESFNVHFGSFARRTQCRALDDIDLMIGIAGNGATYYSSDPWDNIRITASTTNPAQIDCVREDGILNSTKVINKFKKKLENVREYSRSEVKRSGEAVVLNLTSKDWSFDIVPCFKTEVESNGLPYYLIPNGQGNWKKTDPTIDNGKVTDINQTKDGRVLEFVRLFKKWNKVKNAKTLPSYLLETLLIDYCHTVSSLSEYIDFRFKDALPYVSKNIFNPIYDMKNIQGDINKLSYSDRVIISNKANIDYDKACKASNAEIEEKDQKKAINLWGEIFGGDFPTHG